MAEGRQERGRFSGSQRLRERMIAVVGAPGMESVTMPVLSRVHSTLRQGGFIPTDFSFYEQVRNDMYTGLIRAQVGEPSSVSFIRHTLTPRPLVTDGIGQAFVYGGTGYAHSTFEVSNGQIVDELRRVDRPLEPGDNIIELITRDVTKRVGRKRVKVQAVSGNIGQELVPSTGLHGELDGTPTARSQGVKGQTIALRPMGDMVREGLNRPDLPATFANDTVAIADQDGAAIIGTGFNKALIIETESGRIAVNLESGAQKMPNAMSGLIARIDAQLTDPNERDKHEIEKLAAGGYLPISFNLAAEDLNISTRINTAKELDELAESHPGEAGEIARVLLIRSAMLEAAQLAAVYQFMGEHPITLIGDGSLITKGWNGNFKDMVQHGLQMLGVPEGGVTIETPDDVAMRGARGLITGSIDLNAA